jgi:Ca2+-transporting ATPase
MVEVKRKNIFSAKKYIISKTYVASIEHQIDIHVIDLVESAHNSDVSLSDVLAGLEYVMDYRIRGGKMPNLEKDIMSRLLVGLLQNMKHRSGNLLNKKFTPEANLCFILFGEFLQEVVEFREAANETSPSELQFAMVLHKRGTGTPEEKEIAASVLSLVLKYCHQISDYKELVKENEEDVVEELMKDFSEKFKHKAEMTATEKVSFPPQSKISEFFFVFFFSVAIYSTKLLGLYFDKNAEALAAMFSSDTKLGLRNNQIQERRDHYGNNQLPAPPPPSILHMLWTQISDFMIVILLVVAIVDFATDEVPSGVALVLVVILNGTIGFYQEFKANKALEALMSLSVPKVIFFTKKEFVKTEKTLLGNRNKRWQVRIHQGSRFSSGRPGVFRRRRCCTCRFKIM